METITKKRRHQKPGQKITYSFWNFTVLAALAFIGYMNFNNPATPEQWQEAEQAVSKVFTDTEMQSIVEDFIDAKREWGKGGKGKHLIVEKDFNYPTISKVTMDLDVLRFLKDYSDCLDKGNIESLCNVWRKIQGLSGTRNRVLRGLINKWSSTIDDLIKFQQICNPNFDIEEACK